MRLNTMVSAGLLALSGVAIAQVSTTDPKLGNGQAAAQPSNAVAPAGNSTGNTSDPGKP